MRKAALFLLLLLAPFLIMKPASIYAWLDCPFGRVNDSYPGSCSQYINTDKDNICDHSQLPSKERVKPVVEETKSFSGRNYNFLVISLGLLVAYGVSFALTKAKKISVISYYKIWNVILALSFLGTGLSGILLVLRISYGIEIRLPFEMLFWHVETGIVFALVAFFHIAWHWPYFKSLLKIR